VALFLDMNERVDEKSRLRSISERGRWCESPNAETIENYLGVALIRSVDYVIIQ